MAPSTVTTALLVASRVASVDVVVNESFGSFGSLGATYSFTVIVIEAEDAFQSSEAADEAERVYVPAATRVKVRRFPSRRVICSLASTVLPFPSVSV